VSNPEYTATGKQILRDDGDGHGAKHFADAATVEIARALATLLNCDQVQHEPGTPDAELDHMVEVLWG